MAFKKLTGYGANEKAKKVIMIGERVVVVV